MKALAAICLVLISACQPGFAGHRHLESWYADALAKTLGAKTEVRMRNGTRCDVLGTHAIEVEFAGKWCESIGQSLNYASQTGRPGAVALILESKGDERFLTRLREVIAWHKLPIVIVVMVPFNKDGLEFQFPAGIRTRPDLRQPNADLPHNYR